LAPSGTAPVEQAESSGAVPAGRQAGTPLAQERVPSWHGSAEGAQAPPARQVAQAPPKQTPLGRLAQGVPLASALPVSLQAPAPVAQSVMPAWQSLAGVQSAPAEQAVQVPAWQKKPNPQLVPSGSEAAVSAQTWTPVLQRVTPVWHGFCGEQAAKETQGSQAPAWQTWPAPQAVPSCASRAEAVQLGVEEPAPQVSVPSRQGSAGWQLAPPTQSGSQAPARQA